MFEIKTAKKNGVFLRVAISGASGSGKTMSALRLAYGITGNWKTIGVIDTENESSALYEHLGPFQIIPFYPPFSPERYIEALQFALANGLEVIIIDSTSQEWNGAGGILSDNAAGKDNFFAWKNLSPRHDAFINEVLHAKAHTICCFRAEDEYIVTTDQTTGKPKPVKVGLKAVTRKGWEYENTLVFRLDENCLAETSKDRTTLFKNKAPFLITESEGRALANWAGKQPTQTTIPLLNEAEIEAISNKLKECKTVTDLQAYKATLSPQTLEDKSFIKLARKRYQEITGPPVKV